MGFTFTDILEFLAVYWLGLIAVLVCIIVLGYGFIRWRRRYMRHYTPAEWKSAFDHAFKSQYPKWMHFAAESTQGAAQFLACKHKLEQEWERMRVNYRVRSNRQEDLRYQAGMKINGWCHEGNNRDHPPIYLHVLYRSWEDQQIPGRKSA